MSKEDEGGDGNIGDKEDTNILLNPVFDASDAPAKFWQEHPELSRDRVIKYARAFAAGASGPFETYLWPKNLGFAFPSAYAKEHDGPDAETTRQYKSVQGQVKEAIKRSDSAGAKELMSANLELLAQQYKIHLQPLDQDIENCLAELGRFYQDEQSRDLTCSFKVSVNPDNKATEPDQYGLYSPTIVIYPYNGRQNAQALLKRVASHFGQFKEWGSGLTPGFNLALSKLVYFAQSDRNFKITLGYGRLQEEYLDKSLNFAFFKGEIAHWRGVIPQASIVSRLGTMIRR